MIILKIILVVLLAVLALALLLALLLLLLLLSPLILPMRLRLTAQYDKSGPMVYAWAGPVRTQIYPRVKVQPRERKKPEKKQESQGDQLKIVWEALKEGGTMQQLKAMLSAIGPILGQFRRRLAIRELTLHYTVATKDAAMTALAYGGAHAAVSKILLLLQIGGQVKKQDIQINANFENREDLVFLRVRLSMSVWGALCLGIFALRKMIQSGLLQIVRAMLRKRRENSLTKKGAV